MYSTLWKAIRFSTLFNIFQVHRKMELLTCWHSVKLIVPPTLAQGAQEDQTSPWVVIVGDPGCPGIAGHFLAWEEQSKMADTRGQFAPWLMIYFSAPSHMNGHPRFSLTEKQSSWPFIILYKGTLMGHFS